MVVTLLIYSPYFARKAALNPVRHGMKKDHIKGCGSEEGPRTLYVIKHGDPIPLGANFWNIRCGYRPPTKNQNGILLCDGCIAELGLRASSDPKPEL